MLDWKVLIMFCRKCGNQIPDDSDFCPKCGIRVVLESEKSNCDIHGKSLSECSAVVLEKKPKTAQALKLKCSNCGKEIHSKSISFCPYCFADIEYTPGSLDTGKSVVSLEKSDDQQEKDAIYNDALSKLENSNDSYTLKKVREVFVSLYDYRDSKSMAQKCQEKINKINSVGDNIQICSQCGTTLHSWHSRCPNCATPKPGAYRTNAASSQTSQQNSFEEDYQNIKALTLVAFYAIMIVIVLVVFLSGDASCIGGGEISYIPRALSAVIGGAIGLTVLRGIILLIYKATHKNN